MRSPKHTPPPDLFRCLQRQAANDGYNKDFRHHRRNKESIRRWARRQLKRKLNEIYQ